MRDIWRSFIVVLAVLAFVEARRHRHWRRTTTTTTERSTTEIVGEEDASISSDEYNSTESATSSTTVRNGPRLNKTSAIKPSEKNKATTTRPPTTTGKNHKASNSSTHRSSGRKHSGNTTTKITTPKTTITTKKKSKYSSVTHPVKKSSHGNHSTRGSKVSSQKKAWTKEKHYNSTRVPTVTTNNTKSSKAGRESSSSSHKTTKINISSTTPQTSTRKFMSNKTTATNVTKTKKNSPKYHHKIYKTAISRISKGNSTAHGATHDPAKRPFSSRTSKQSTGSTTLRVTKSKVSKNNETRNETMDTTLPRPATNRPATWSTKVPGRNSTTNSTTARSRIPSKHRAKTSRHGHRWKSSAHAPISSTIKTATMMPNKTVGSSMKLGKGSRGQNAIKEESRSTTTIKPSPPKERTTKIAATQKTLAKNGTQASPNPSNVTIAEAKPATSLATKKRVQPRFTYIVTDKHTGIPCLLSRMSISMMVEYKMADHAIAEGSLVVPNNAKTYGTCAQKMADMKLVWNSPGRRRRELPGHFLNTVILNFVSDGKTATLDRILFELYLDKEHFPGAIEKLVRGNTTKGLGLFRTTSNKGNYVCDHEIDVNAGGTRIKIANVSLIAFNKDRIVTSKKEENCKAQEGFKKMATIVGVLGMALLLCAFGTCIWRKKSRPYDNSTLP